MSLSEEQLAQRRLGVTGTDAAMIVGMSPYGTAADVWIDKKHPQAKSAPTEAERKRWETGHFLEDVICSYYEKENKVTLLNHGSTFTHPTVKWLLATPDRLIKDTKRGLDAKNVSEWMKHLWGPSGTDIVPQHILIQAQHYMMVFGFYEWDICALIGGNRFQMYRIYGDKELQSMLYDAEKKFYENFIIGDKEPAFDGGSEQLRQYVLGKWPTHSDRSISVDPYGDAEIKRAIKTLIGARRLEKQYKSQVKAEKVIIARFMEDASELVWEDEEIFIKYKKPMDGVKVDWAKIAQEAIEKSGLSSEEISELKSRHTSVKKNTRKITITDKSGDDGEEGGEE